MIRFPFKFSSLQALALIASTDETRYVLNGINIVLDPNKPVRLQASDGRRVVQFDTEWGHDAQAVASVILPVSLLSAILQPLSDNFLGTGRDGICEIDSGRVTLRFGEMAFSAKEIQGNYPTFTTILLEPRPNKFPSAMFFNAELLRGFMDAVIALNPWRVGSGAPAIKFVCQKGEGDEALFVIGKNLYGALMPLRVNL